MILVTGCNPLGERLLEELNKDGMAKGACHKEELDLPRGFIKYDIFSSEDIERLVKEVKPDTMILTEEVSDLEYCEQKRSDAMQFNTRGVRFFVEAAQKTGASVVLISTAYVFDGRKEGGMYTENDMINPINVYGETRLMAEVHTDKAPSYLIARMGELYGNYPGNFADFILTNIKYGEKVELARDMYFSPIYIDDAVAAIKLLTAQKMFDKHNVAGPERISHYDFGLKIAKTFGLNENLIVPVSVEDLNLTVMMPKDLSLDISKIGPLVKIRNVDEGLEAMKKALE
ncbi:NAD(P)-dependent oxidoreductase [Methanocella sp. CWC-04]|uniref:NAD(P)-dependent oxidoreductase n=2 Tax=Methanooceanicella nereidis TaxID=2052831 RepID=A0AAP2REX9_9EURY|nr:NAD(P)-dependent oxidoreductase [Methanocella sp. CWC-04]